MAITNVSVFRSGDGGVGSSAVLGRASGTAGDVIGLMNMLLLNGYNWQELSPSGLTQTGNVATVTLASHGFNIDQRLWLVGASQSAYNSDAIYPFTLAPAATLPTGSFTYQVSGSPTSPATAAGSTTLNGAIVSTTATSIPVTSGASFPSSGTCIMKVDSEWMLITAGLGTNTFTVVRGFGNSTAATHLTGAAVTQKILIGVAPAGGQTHWTADFTATNKSTYRPPAGNRFYIDLDDSAAQSCLVRYYETMSAVGTGTGPFPTVAQLALASGNFTKSSSASTAARMWECIATDRFCILINHPGDVGVISNPTSMSQIVLADLIDLTKSGDVYATLGLLDTSVASSGNQGIFSLLTNTSATSGGHYMPRAYTQVGTSIQCSKVNQDGRRAPGTMGASGLAYPHGPDGGAYLSKIVVNDGVTNTYRGTLPGVWDIMHTKPFTHLDTWPGTGTFAGKRFMAVNVYNAGQCAFEISNTIQGT